LHLLRILTVAEDRNENQKDTKERCGEETDQESYPLVDTEPVWENWITIEKAWIDEAGNHWYKISFVGWVYPSGAGKEVFCFTWNWNFCSFEIALYHNGGNHDQEQKEIPYT